MIKFMYLLAGIALASSLQAGRMTRTKTSGQGAWIIFTDRKNQLWSVLEGEMEEYYDLLQHEVLFSYRRTRHAHAELCLEPAKRRAAPAGIPPGYFHLRKRPRVILVQKKSASCS
jgi:hypothetical protein